MPNLIPLEYIRGDVYQQWPLFDCELSKGSFRARQGSHHVPRGQDHKQQFVEVPSHKQELIGLAYHT